VTENVVSSSHVTQVPSSAQLQQIIQSRRPGNPQEQGEFPVPFSASGRGSNAVNIAGQSLQPSITHHVRPPNPVLVAFQNALPKVNFASNPPTVSRNESATTSRDYTYDPLPLPAAHGSAAAGRQNTAALMVMQDGTSDSYMGSYDADISWALDSFNVESKSNSDYEIGDISLLYPTHGANPLPVNTFEVPDPQFHFTQVPPHSSSLSEDPIDVADNEDEDTNDWPDKVHQPSNAPRRAPRIVPLRFIPVPWQPLLDEARDMRLSTTLPNLQRVDDLLRQSLLESLNGDDLCEDDESIPRISDSMFPPSEVLELFLVLYFQHIQPRFPILHLPTFNIHICPSLLLVAMIILGSSHSKSDRGRFARLFHGPLRISCMKRYCLDPNYVCNLLSSENKRLIYNSYEHLITF
jgi:hypothetical protein